MRVLVTGCGGDIGQSVGKILNESKKIKKIYGCDISNKNAGIFIFKNFFISKPCNDKRYLTNLKSFINSNQINLVIPISEPELRFFSNNKILRIGNAKLLMPSSIAMNIGFDKFLTYDFLKKIQAPFPKTKLFTDCSIVKKFPVIIKSRFGSGSSSVEIIKNVEHFNFKKNDYNENYIIQEYIQGDNNEYTCGLFRSKSGEIRTIIIKRELLGGFTVYGEVVKNSQIDKLLIKIAKSIELIGSINVQLKLTPKGPIVFEINPRFSSTVRYRDLLGFKDVIWSIEDHFNKSLSVYKNSSFGKKIYKGFTEYIK